MARQLSEAARAAKSIRLELKRHFPAIKFKVLSETYAGGDAVNISYENGVVESEIKAITDKYKYGSFNSMEDIYESDNRHECLPQTKFLFIDRDFSDDQKKIAAEILVEQFQIEDPENDIEWNEKTGDRKMFKVRQHLHTLDLSIA